MRTVAVLPVKRFARAKQRLRAAVDGMARERLAEAMVGDVLEVVSPTVMRVVVVTAEPAATAAATEAGAHVVHDAEEAGQSAAAALGIEAAVRELDAQRVLLVPGDTPGVDAGELAALLARREPVAIVTDRHGTGTNALLLAPPDVIAPAFGPGSRARHEEAARAAGVDWAVVDLPSLTHDVDTPEDLTALIARCGLGRGADTPEDLAALRARGRLGPRTAAALADLVPA